ncbi:MAG: RnfH family protein [Rhodanobacteraceae bacterium]
MAHEARRGGFIVVEVAYAEPERQFLRRIELPPDSTVAQALAISGMTLEFGTACADLSFGIWSKPATLQSILRDGDRVEAYRPLKVDPKEARRLRARKVARAKAAVDEEAGENRAGREDQPP